MKYKLAIFDLDGTILNTLDDLADSCNAVLKTYNMPLHTYEEIRFMVGNGIPKLVERAVPQGKENPLYEKVLESYIEYYEKHCAEKTCPYDGILNALMQMKNAGMKVAVNTNKVSQAAQDLCCHYFNGIFDYICGSSPDIPVKPAPEGVNKILNQSGIKKEDTVYIGDSDVDIQTGKNAGIDVISVAWGFRGETFLQEHCASCIVQNTQQLLEKLDI